MVAKIRVGDSVVVISGRDKGRIGRVLSFVKSSGDRCRVVVSGVGLCKKHKKGGFVVEEGSVAISNVALFDSASGRPSRVGIRIDKDNRRVRFLKSSGEVIG